MRGTLTGHTYYSFTEVNGEVIRFPTSVPQKYFAKWVTVGTYGP